MKRKLNKGLIHEFSGFANEIVKYRKCTCMLSAILVFCLEFKIEDLKSSNFGDSTILV